MTQDLGIWLAGLPIEAALIVIVGGGVLFTLIGIYVMNRVALPAALEDNNMIVGGKLSFVGEVYAVTLALALIGAYDHYTAARDNVQVEASTLRSLKSALQVYDDPSQLEQRSQMKLALERYSRAVAEKEWRTMTFGIPSFEADLRLDEMIAAFILIEPLNNRQQMVQQNTVDWLRDVTNYRQLRLTTISRSLVSLVWALTLTGTLVALVLPWFYGTPNLVTLTVLSAMITAFLMLYLLVIVKLAYPFVGETAVSPRPFLELSQ